MAKREIFIFITFAALALANESEDVEPTKRGAGKANALNAIPSAVQKPEYTYNLYSAQNHNVQSNPSQSYQVPLSNSFYPNQESNTYYNPGQSVDATPANPSHQQTNVPAQTIQSQFVPINFLPNPGYQNKYQIIPTKPSANIQLAILQQPSPYPTSPLIQYPQTLFQSAPSSHIAPQNTQLLNPFANPGHYSFAPNFQPLSLGSPAISQPPAMIYLPNSNPNLYNNLLYPNPSQSFYNYYPSQSQAKYSYSSGGSIATSNEYDKGQPSVSQGIPKGDSDINIPSNEYVSPPDSSTGYKTTYSRRSTYSKLK